MMRIPMIQGVGVVVFICLILQMTYAFSIMNNLPEDDASLMRAKQSTGTKPPLICIQEEVDNLTKDARETCSQIGSVDTYNRNLNSKQPISVPSFKDNHGFNNILSQYNNDLQTAKNNSQPWRNGDSILSSIQVVIEESKDFELNFNREFEQNHERVKYILENHEDIAEFESTIAELREEIREAKEAAKLASVPSTQVHLEKLIKSKEEYINNTVKDHQVLQAKRELEELLEFLEFVRNNSAEIKGKADNARTKISGYRDDISRDSSAFKRHRSNAQEGIKRLSQEKQNNYQELANIRKQKGSLNRQIEAERAQINALNGEIGQALRDLQCIEATIAKSERRARRKKLFGKLLSIAGGWVIRQILSRRARRELDDLANFKRNLINENTGRIQSLEDQITQMKQDIAHYQNMINIHESNSRQIEEELSYFNILDGNLLSVEREVDSILPKMANAITSVSQMREIFDKLRQHMEVMIERAKVSKTEAEMRNIKYFIYNEIDQLKCKWDKASEKIGDLGQCQL